MYSFIRVFNVTFVNLVVLYSQVPLAGDGGRMILLGDVTRVG